MNRNYLYIQRATTFILDLLNEKLYLLCGIRFYVLCKNGFEAVFQVCDRKLNEAEVENGIENETLYQIIEGCGK